jgi:hypothetical protein
VDHLPMFDGRSLGVARTAFVEIMGSFGIVSSRCFSKSESGDKPLRTRKLLPNLRRSREITCFARHA